MAELIAGLVDVFAETPFNGNPLAVVEGGDELTDAQMRRIAGEFNQAETTFLLRSSRRLASSLLHHRGRGSFRRRSQCARRLAVAGGAGQARLARDAAYVSSRARRRCAAHRDGACGRTHLRPHAPGAAELLAPLTDVAPLASALGLRTEDIQTNPPPRPAHTGATHLLVRVTDASTVDRALPKHEALLPVLRDAGAEGCYIYAHDSKNPESAYARFFNPTVGLWEDAATGTAAGPRRLPRS